MSNNSLEIHKVEWTQEKVSKVWDYYSNNDVYQDIYFSKQVGDIVYQYAQRFITKSTIKSILDYGCGQGHMLRHLLSLTSKHQKCYGIDFSKTSVERVNQALGSHPRFNGAHLLGSTSDRIAENSIDLILVLEIVEHLDDDQLNVMKAETFRTLRKGGYIVVTTPNRENLQAGETICPDCGCVFHRWQHIRMWDREDLVIDMEKSGFKTIHINETNFQFKNFILTRLFLKLFPKFKKNLIYIGQK